MNAQQVAAALARPPRQQPDGTVVCQVCGEAFSRQGLGPHQIKHRLATGLLERRREIKLPKGVRIPCPECGDRLLNHSLVSHLKRVHRFSADAAVNSAQKIRQDFAADLNGDSKPEPSREVALRSNGDGPEQEPESLYRETSAVDVTTDVLNRARVDGLVPVKLLPDIFEWTVATGKLLHKLERMSR